MLALLHCTLDRSQSKGSEEPQIGQRDKFRFASGDERMSVVTIPFDFEQLPPAAQSSIVPIAIPALDDDGSSIAWGWFEAVERVQNPLRGLARTFLGDVWRVSELTESAVKSVWRTHREDYGRSPSTRIYVQAKWTARDMRAGGSRNRRGLDVELGELDKALCERILTDACDYQERYAIDMDLAVLGQRLCERNLEDINEILMLVRDANTWKEIGDRLSCDPNVTQRRFRRWMGKAASLLGLD